MRLRYCAYERVRGAKCWRLVLLLVFQWWHWACFELLRNVCNAKDNSLTMRLNTSTRISSTALCLLWTASVLAQQLPKPYSVSE